MACKKMVFISPMQKSAVSINQYYMDIGPLICSASNKFPGIIGNKNSEKSYQENKKICETRIQVQVAVAAVENKDTHCIACTEYFCHFLKRVIFVFILLCIKVPHAKTRIYYCFSFFYRYNTYPDVLLT
jgi:hypothetical protein